MLKNLIVLQFLLSTVFKINKAEDEPAIVLSGNHAVLGQFPFMVAVIKDYIVCSGTLIGAEYVLTAAHCIMEEEKAPEFTCVAGDIYPFVLTENQVTRQEREVIKAVIHPEARKSYKELQITSKKADLAVLTMNSAFNLNKYVEVVSLATSHLKMSFTAVVVGYGRFKRSPNRKANYFLHWGELNLDTKFCENMDAKFNLYCIRNESQIIYSGDDGGALLDRIQNPILFGIASRTGYISNKYVGFYSKVGPYEDWILSQISSAQSRQFLNGMPSKRSSQYRITPSHLWFVIVVIRNIITSLTTYYTFKRLPS